MQYSKAGHGERQNGIRIIHPEEKKCILCHRCPACVAALMNPLISMTLAVDHFINNL